jgi:tetratricopeptide (TPR) repeat protein
MATKAKLKAKAPKKPAGRVSGAAKSVRLKAKAAKNGSRNGSRNGSKPVPRQASRRPSKVESRRTPVVVSPPASGAPPADRSRSKAFVSAVQAYEAAIKLMHAEEFGKAKRCFEDLIAGHSEEPEIQERAKVLLHVCEKKIQDKGGKVLRSADDYYNVGVAELNRRQLDIAIDYLQQALKAMPKGDHIFYALATANALKGNRDQALQCLTQAIRYRGENRFLAARDSDFESLQEDPEFRQLIAAEK